MNMNDNLCCSIYFYFGQDINIKLIVSF